MLRASALPSGNNAEMRARLLLISLTSTAPTCAIVVSVLAGGLKKNCEKAIANGTKLWIRDPSSPCFHRLHAILIDTFFSVCLYIAASFDLPVLEALFPGEIHSALDLMGNKSTLARLVVAALVIFFALSFASTAVARHQLIGGIRALVSVAWRIGATSVSSNFFK